MADNSNNGTWVGFFITAGLWVLSGFLKLLGSMSLADWAMVSTILAGLSATGYTVYKWIKGK